MRRNLMTFAAFAACLFPAAALAQGAGARVVAGTGIDAFGGIYTIAPNPAVTLEGLGRDIGRDSAAHWGTYRWAAPGRSKAQCEVNLNRFDHLGFYAEQPDQTALDAKEIARFKQLAAAPTAPWVSSSVQITPWGRLTLIELASLRDDGAEILNVESRYVDGPYVYTISYFCNGAPLTALRDLQAAIKARNITQKT